MWKKLHHAPAEHPYAQIPVPVQEVYAVPESSHISGYNHNSGFPGLPEATPYSVSPSYQGQWTEQNHNNYTPNLAPEYQQENAYPVAPAAQVNSPFPPFVADTHMNQQPFISLTQHFRIHLVDVADICITPLWPPWLQLSGSCVGNVWFV